VTVALVCPLSGPGLGEHAQIAQMAMEWGMRGVLRVACCVLRVACCQAPSASSA
jgi:hypothetical protein